MSDEKYAGSKLYYPDELQFQKNSEFTILNYDRVVAGQDEGNSQTAFLNKVLIVLETCYLYGKIYNPELAHIRQDLGSRFSRKESPKIPHFRLISG